MSGSGGVIFPGDEVPDEGIDPGLNQHMVASCYLGMIPKEARATWSASLYLLGCADYVLQSGGTEHHQTGFVFSIGRVIRGGGQDVYVPGVGLPLSAPGDIRLTPFPLAENAIN
jgi:hypothetical protein